MIGRLETIIVIKAPFNNPHDYGYGMNTNKKSIRIFIGKKLGVNLNSLIKNELDSNQTHQYLKEGNYELFVNYILQNMNSCMEKFKKNHEISAYFNNNI